MALECRLSSDPSVWLTQSQPAFPRKDNEALSPGATDGSRSGSIPVAPGKYHPPNWLARPEKASPRRDAVMLCTGKIEFRQRPPIVAYRLEMSGFLEGRARSDICHPRTSKSTRCRRGRRAIPKSWRESPTKSSHSRGDGSTVRQ